MSTLGINNKMRSFWLKLFDTLLIRLFPNGMPTRRQIFDSLVALLFLVDLIFIIPDSLGILNTALLPVYIVWDTVTSAFLLYAWWLSFKESRNEKKSKFASAGENFLLIIGSLPWALLFEIIINWNGNIPASFIAFQGLARLLRLVPRIRALFNLSRLITRLNNKKFLVAVITAGLWGVVFAISPANLSVLILMGGLSLAIALFAIVYEFHEKFMKGWLDNWKKDVETELRAQTQKLEIQEIRTGKLGIDEEIKRLGSVIDDFNSKDPKDIQLLQIEKLEKTLLQLRRLTKKHLQEKDQFWSDRLHEAYKKAEAMLLANLLRSLVVWVINGLAFIVMFSLTIQALQYLKKFLLFLINIKQPNSLYLEILSWLQSFDPQYKLILGLVGILVFFLVLRYAIRLLVQLTDTPLDDLAGAFVPFPVAALLFVDLLNATFPQVLEIVTIGKTNNAPGINLLYLLLGTAVAIGLFNGVVIFALKIQAEKTDSQYDDLLVRLTQRLGMILIVFIALVIALPKIDWSSESILSAVLAALASAGLLYIGRDFAENFFAGIYLVAAKPFEPHDRIHLADDVICDVREIGITGTRLYRVNDNTEIVMPTTLMARNIIVNLSKPDMTIRLEMVVFIKQTMLIQKATRVIMGIIWSEPEVVKLAIEEVQSSLNSIGQSHRTLKKDCDELSLKLDLIRKIHKAIPVDVFSGDGLDKVESLSAIVDECKTQALSMLNKKLDTARPEIQNLALFLSRHPYVVSDFHLADGYERIALKIIFFSQYVERQPELIGKITSQIQKKFSDLEILSLE